RIGARTIPLCFGPRIAGAVILATLGLTVLLGLGLPRLSPLSAGWAFQLAILIAGVWLLLLPAIGLVRTLDGRQAARLFDRASLYPVPLLAIATGFVPSAEGTRVTPRCRIRRHDPERHS